MSSPNANVSLKANAVLRKANAVPKADAILLRDGFVSCRANTYVPGCESLQPTKTIAVALTSPVTGRPTINA
jgi:hypothetical protein